MKVEKITVYRIVANITCGCSAQREFKDEFCKEAIGEAEFTPCTKHKGKGEAAGMAELLLTERVQEEAEKSEVEGQLAKVAAVAATAAADTPADEASTSTDEGGVVTRIPIRRPMAPARVGVRPAAGATLVTDPAKIQAIRNTQIVTGQRSAPTPAVRPAAPAPAVRPAPAPGQPVRTGPVKTPRPTAPTQAAPTRTASAPVTTDVHEAADRLERAQATNVLDAFLEGGGGDDPAERT